MMNAQETSKPVVKKDNKRKIKIEFDRTPLKERLKAKFLSMSFVANIVWYAFRLILLLGISYIILYPFFTKIAGSIMAPDDFVDVTVRLIPKHFSIDIYKAIITDNGYLTAFRNTFAISFASALIQTFICSLIAYGLAKFKFKGRKLIFFLVIFSMIVPHPTLQLSMYMKFRYFDIFGIFSFLSGGASTGIGFLDGLLSKIHIMKVPNGFNLLNTFWPMAILSVTGLAFKNGLYIFMLRQFFNGVPDELEESAYIDGSGTFRTFFQIILPLSIPMMITVFLFSFCWQWTDDFYTGMFIISSKITLFDDIIKIPKTLITSYAGQTMYYAAIRNTCGLMILFPLVVLYLFCQKFLVQGIERSGIVG